MFERYTEAARRALFYARSETVQLGGVMIETEHMLLGILRDAKGIVGVLVKDAGLSYEEVRAEAQARAGNLDNVSTRAEIPFSAETSRVLRAAAEEADRLRHNYIRAEHLLLGLLREPTSVAASILTAHGVTLDAACEKIARLVTDGANAFRVSSNEVRAMERIQAIRRELQEIGRIESDVITEALARLNGALDALERLLR